MIEAIQNLEGEISVGEVPVRTNTFSFFTNDYNLEPSSSNFGIDLNIVEDVPDYAFYDENGSSYSARNYHFSRKLCEVTFEEGIKSIGKYGFSSNITMYCTKLPKSLKTIGNYAFEYCQNLYLEELPNLDSIGDNAFKYCYGLRIKKIPDTITEILNSTFYACTGLKQISMKNVTSIGGSLPMYGAFFSCKSLVAMWIGSAITSDGIGKCALGGCSSLKKLYIDLPRATVEEFTNYDVCFSYVATIEQSVTPDKIICNDDEGFITKEEFDAIDWSTYTEDE